MSIRNTVAAVVMAASIVGLSACDSSEKRADKYYQSGMSYLEKGDIDRALVEFRNVFKLNGRHKDARLAYARAEQQRGNLREAYGQYLRLVEQYPDDLEGLRALAEIAVQTGNWAEARKNVDAVFAKAPADPRTRVTRAVLDYGVAAEDNDAGGMVAAAQRARELRKEFPDELMLRRIIIDDHLRAQDLDAALTELDSAIELAPKDTTLYATRLSVYAAQNDEAKVEAGLIDMVDRFPAAPEMSEALVRWYVARDQLDRAETHLRDRIARNQEDPQRLLQLIRFLAQYRGPDAAVTELDKLIGEGKGTPVLRSARAGFLFDLGRQDEAIAEMRDILKQDVPAPDRQKIKVGLARMLSVAGNPVAARALVEEVLADDSGDVEAMKLKANWLILDDSVGEAITVLRAALSQNPRDASIMTLMAQAYERDGNRDLMREMLASAVEASNRAPEESLRYAQFLAGEGKLLPAESVLLDALRLSPGNMALLPVLGQIYVQMKDWPRAQAVVQQMETLADPNAAAPAGALRAAVIAGQQSSTEALSYLQSLADAKDAGLEPKLAVVRARIANGQLAEARAYAEQLMSEYPAEPTVRFLAAGTRAMSGDTKGATELYRALLAEDDKRTPVWMALFRTLSADPATADEAASTLEDALRVLPEDGELLWAKAGLLERDGKIDEAIAIYEDLYKKNSANPIVANNLASLLSSYRTDAESLAKAEVIARRLRGSDVPPYQDTYGWIAFLRGNYNDALAELEKAAAGLPDEPSVHYHLARTYEALNRKPEALAAYEKAGAAFAASDSGPLASETRAAIKRLKDEGVKIP